MALARKVVEKLIWRSNVSYRQCSSSASSYWGTWEPTNNPRVAQARLVKIRKDYKMQVSELRKQYYNELQAQKLEEDAMAKLRRSRVLAAKEKRNAAKKEQARLSALERLQQQAEFTQLLLKEKAEKAERQMRKLRQIEKRRDKDKELIRQKSSQWIDEKELDRRIVEAFVDTTQL
ncbi:hypothetical protein SUGI_1050920 [Cryptomeria japonica]|uniref:uncharacterized protein LOC131039432 n=1 Tax=Cryptomeria japonica TaxID=3369 RepID=UPI0024146E71|nr:uncharacterized protein LOC131039432 [Cryptomeria japonica]GLJ49549.1 hypothetical protein SUGI_1050920 [Cryptomeria japonica]